MYRLIGFFTQNTMKPLYVLEELGVEYEFKFLNLFEREQREEWFLEINPIGKAPALTHDDLCLFESGAICRYVANNENSSLYPEDKKARAKVDQWLDFFSAHLGRWMNTLFFETIIKCKFGLGYADERKIEEAYKFLKRQYKTLNSILANQEYIAGNEISIADLTAFAYIEQAQQVNYSLDDFSHVKGWFKKLEQRASIQNGRAKVKEYI